MWDPGTATETTTSKPGVIVNCLRRACGSTTCHHAARVSCASDTPPMIYIPQQSSPGPASRVFFLVYDFFPPSSPKKFREQKSSLSLTCTATGSCILGGSTAVAAVVLYCMHRCWIVPEHVRTRYRSSTSVPCCLPSLLDFLRSKNMPGILLGNSVRARITPSTAY